MRKQIFLIIVAVVISATTGFCKTRSTLEKLWDEYHKYEKLDRPKDQAETLLKIKTDARKIDSAWDFYEASIEYVRVCSSLQYTRRQELQAQMDREVEQFGSPIMLFYHKRYEMSIEGKVAFLLQNEALLQSSHNQKFYRNGLDYIFPGMPDILPQLLVNDYDYVLWCLYTQSLDEKTSTLIHRRFTSQYPFDSLLEYYDLNLEANNLDVHERISSLESFARKHADRAVSLMAAQDLARIKLSTLDQNNGSEEQFLRLDHECDSIIGRTAFFRKSGNAADRIIAKACKAASEIKNALRDKDISAVVKKDTLYISLINISTVKVEIFRDGDKSAILSKQLKNEKRSFHVTDSIILPLGVLEDGDYNLECSSSKLQTSITYRKHSISLAMEDSDSGLRFYAADFMSGEPIYSYTLTLSDGGGKAIGSGSMSASNGFEAPEHLYIDRSKRNIFAQAKYKDAKGRLHSSDLIRLTPKRPRDFSDESNVSCMILLDRSAFNPGDTVRFKVIAYSGVHEFATAPAGTELEMSLSDPEGRNISNISLKTDEFGAASGCFFLEKGHMGGTYNISARESGKTIGLASITVDEFELPSFEVIWDNDVKMYFFGDKICVSGSIQSFNSHKLSGAHVRYKVSHFSDVIQSGELTIHDNGRFDIRFDSGEELRYGNFVLKLSITDVSGETLSFSKHINCQSEYRMTAEFPGSGKGRFTLTDGSSGTTFIPGSKLIVDYSISSWSEQKLRPGLAIRSSILRGRDTVLIQDSRLGRNSFDISSLSYGVYTLITETSVYTDSGKELKSSRKDIFMVLKDGEAKALPENVKTCFCESIDESLSISVGSGDAPIWVVSVLYSDSVPVESKLTKIDRGHLEAVSFSAWNSSKDNLSIRMLFFKDAASYTYLYTRPSDAAPQDNWTMAFTRFLDTTAPGTRYRFSLHGPAEAQYAIGIYDKASETVRNNRWSTRTPAQAHDMIPASIDFINGSFNSMSGIYMRPLFKSSSRMMLANNMSIDYAESAQSEEFEDSVGSSDQMEEATIRQEFNKTLAWEPMVRSDADGNLDFSFKTSDKLTTYVVQVFAHDKTFHNAVISKEMTVTLPVTISLIQPSYLYYGDKYSLRVGLSNSTSEKISGKVRVRFINGSDYNNRKTVIREKSMEVIVPEHGNASADCELSIPDISTLGILVSFTPDKGGNCSDAVFVKVPVKVPFQTITEAHSAILKNEASRESIIRNLRKEFVNIASNKAKVEEISILQMLSDALPEKISVRNGSVDKMLETLYADVLASRLPQDWRIKGLSDSERGGLIDKILACRNSDGGFSWMPDMQSSPSITALVVEWCAMMGDGCDSSLRSIIPSAISYLDKYMTSRQEPGIWRQRLSLSQYLYARSFYPALALYTEGADSERLKSLRIQAKDYLLPKDSRGLQGQIIAKARRLSTLDNLYSSEDNAFARSLQLGLFANAELRKSIAKDVESLSQYAVEHGSGGYYFPNAASPWGSLLESDLYAHTILCDLMGHHGHKDIAEGIRLWIMVQKESRHWENDFAYIRALDCVLNGDQTTLQTKVLSLKASSALPFDKIKASGNGMSITREYYANGQRLSEVSHLKVGDSVKAVYTITTEQTRDFVRITIPRNASLTPIENTSGAIYNRGPIYRNVTSDTTEYWMDTLPEGRLVLTEELHVVRAGTFQTAVPEVVSLYSDHYRANGGFEPAEVINFR